MKATNHFDHDLLDERLNEVKFNELIGILITVKLNKNEPIDDCFIKYLQSVNKKGA